MDFVLVCVILISITFEINVNSICRIAAILKKSLLVLKDKLAGGLDALVNHILKFVNKKFLFIILMGL